MGNTTVLTIGLAVLLGLFSLAANGLINDNQALSDQSEYYITAFSLAQSIIDEAKTKAFDQVTITSPVTSPLSLTAPTLLGPDAGEAIPAPDSSSLRVYKSTKLFNDVDDYNGYVRLVNSPRANGYRLSVTVCYASPTCPDSILATQSYCKRMVVTVTSPYLPQPMSMEYGFIY